LQSKTLSKARKELLKSDPKSVQENFKPFPSFPEEKEIFD
jgi:hypothetical protein